MWYVIFWGTKLYGRIDWVPGQFFIATKFFYIQLVPLIPLETYLVFDDNNVRDDRDYRVIPVGLSLKSTLVGWLRAVLWPTTVFGVLMAIRNLVWLFNQEEQPHLVATRCLLAVVFALCLWLTYRLFSRASRENALYWAQRARLQPTVTDSGEVALLQSIAPGDTGDVPMPPFAEVLQEPDVDHADEFAFGSLSSPTTPSPLRLSPQPSGAPKWLAPVLMLGIFIVFMGGVLWIMSIQNEKQRVEMERRHAYLAPFTARLPEYMPARLTRDIQRPYRRGKLMPIKLPNKEIDWIIFDLPEQLRAAQPDEIGTIAWLEWSREQFGVYSSGQPAFVITCKVTLIDKSNDRIIAEQNFRGGDPPPSRKNDQPNHGSFPTGDVIGWLARLPMK